MFRGQKRDPLYKAAHVYIYKNSHGLNVNLFPPRKRTLVLFWQNGLKLELMNEVMKDPLTKVSLSKEVINLNIVILPTTTDNIEVA